MTQRSIAIPLHGTEAHLARSLDGLFQVCPTLALYLHHSGDRPNFTEVTRVRTFDPPQ